jgi:hypothetical protein
MPNDVFYGTDAEMRIGIMADAATDPTSWSNLEFVSYTHTPTRERNARPKIGRPRNNPLDPIKPIPGFGRGSAELVLDADSRMLPLALRTFLGAPTTSGPVSAIYTHLWASGARAPQYAAIQIKFAGDADALPVRVYRGVTLNSLAVNPSGEQTQNFDVNIALRSLRRSRVAAWIGSAPSAMPAIAPMARAQLLVNDVAASDTLQASWSYDRNLVEDVFLSPTPELSGLRPGETGLSGSAQFRALAAAFDLMEEQDTEFAARVQMLGVVASHELDFEHPHAQLNAPALPIAGPGLIERSVAWFAYQDAITPGAKITVKNDIVSYP